MRIEQVEVVNLLGIAAVALTPKAPVILVAGPNGGGKSSLYQAIKLALLDDLPRVDWKREAPSLIRGGASKASVRVVCDGVESGASIGTAGRTRADSAQVKDGPVAWCLPWCLSPDSWLTASDDDRAEVIRELAGVSLSAEDLTARLTARGLPAPMIEATVPLFAAGWDACLESAQEQAAQARGAWKQITGETYGAVKAVHWKPAAVGPVPEAPLGHDDAVQAHADAVAWHSKLKVAIEQAATAAANRERDRILAGRFDELRDAVAKLEPIAEGEVEPPTLECPQCNASLVLRDGQLAPFQPVPRPTVSAADRIKARAALGPARREFAVAEAAISRLKVDDAFGASPVSAEDVAAAAENEALAADALRTLSSQHDAHAKAKAAAEAAGDTAARARAAHERVEGWVRMAEAFGPAGIPSEVMAQAMAPYRKALAKIGAPEGWPLPEIADNGAVSAWGRPAALLSESERYRVAAVLSAAVASMSGVRLLMMDRADVLEPKARAGLLGWLCDLADAGHIKQAWVFCTLKAPIASGGDIETYWIENGGIS